MAIGTIRFGYALLLASVCVALAAAASAHHSQSEFDFRMSVDVEGTVTELRWLSPHARLYVDVVDENGGVENWNFELPSPTTLMRRGWTRKSLQPGDRVTVSAARAKNFPTIAYARSIRDVEGNAMFTGITEIHEPPPVPDSAEQ
jgi:hypothetical protein